MALLPELAARLVPLKIAEIQANGGPNWARIGALAQQLPWTEALMLGGASDEERSALIEALALLAFLPGGVRFGACHFEVKVYK